MRLSPKTKIAVIPVLFIIFFLILNLTPFEKEVKNFFYLLSSPAQKVLWSAGARVSGFFEFIVEMKQLKEENERLKLEKQELLAKSFTLEELRKENQILRKALDMDLEKEFQLRLARVTGKYISQDSILLDKGSRDGISEGSPVITQHKVLIGRIVKVYRNFSEVILISHPQSSFDGKIIEIYESDDGTDDGILAMVKGEGNLRLIFDLIPREEEVSEGDLLVTSALGGVFPPGLLVGEINQIEKADPEPFYRADISPFFNITKLEQVFIVLDW